MEEVEEGKKFVVEEGHAGPKKRGGGSRWREESARQRVQDEEHVQRPNAFRHSPRITTRKVEPGPRQRCAAHRL